MVEVNKWGVDLDIILSVIIEGKTVKDDVLNAIMRGSTTLRTHWDASFYKAIIKKM